LRVLLLEPRSEFTHDRTWCFWNVLPNPFEDCVSHRWPSWSVADTTRRIDRSAPGLTYDHLPSDLFYDRARQILADDPRVELRLGVRVETLEQVGDLVRIETDGGDLMARLALDSRPRRSGRRRRPAPDRRCPALLQHFHGETIRTETEVFDPSVATVMDFRVSQDRGIHFVYLLPFDARTALVEDTYFAEEPRPIESYKQEIAGYVRTRFGVNRYEVLHSETGAIPMDACPPAPGDASRILDIGTRGGAARPSTGYAFLAIQRNSALLADRLVSWAADPALEPPKAVPHYSARSAFLDRVFLSRLIRHPESAPEMFLRMFESVPPAALARFLFDGGSISDELRVMSALPAAPLIAETLRVYGPRSRARRTRA
jgi:lycopene beta-cyclase